MREDVGEEGLDIVGDESTGVKGELQLSAVFLMKVSVVSPPSRSICSNATWK